MIEISLESLIYNASNIINLFLSGYICVSVFNWLNHKKNNFYIMAIWSICISYIIKSVCSAIHCVFLSEYIIPTPFKVLMFSVIGLIAAFVCTYFMHNKLVKWLLLCVNFKTVNDDIFDDVIDYNEITIMQVYLKNSQIVYRGVFKYKEEKESDAYIVLCDYGIINESGITVSSTLKQLGYHSIVLINLRDIERIEIIYGKNSKKGIYLDNVDIIPKEYEYFNDGENDN